MGRGKKRGNREGKKVKKKTYHKLFVHKELAQFGTGEWPK